MPKGQKTKADDWLALIDEWKQSHLNKKEFCLRHAINYKNFTKWYSRLVNAKKIEPITVAKTSAIHASLFVPVELKTAEQHHLSARPLVLILNKQLQLQIPAETMNESLLTILFKSLRILSC